MSLNEMSADDYNRYVATGKIPGEENPKPLKYKNHKVEKYGRKWDSKAELAHYETLVLLQDAGEIEGLECQKRHRIEVNGVLVCHYVSDFTYRLTGSQKLVVVDVKSAFTAKNPVYRLKKKLMLAVLGIDVQEVMSR